MTEEQKTTDEPTKETTSFRTKDLNQAAFLWCQPGAVLKKLDAEQSASRSGRSVYFIFVMPMSEVDLGKLIFEYANCQTCVEPQAYCQKQSNLRDLLHGNLKTKGVA